MKKRGEATAAFSFPLPLSESPRLTGAVSCQVYVIIAVSFWYYPTGMLITGAVGLGRQRVIQRAAEGGETS
jgi:hypothetical protein